MLGFDDLLIKYANIFFIATIELVMHSLSRKIKNHKNS